LAETLTLTEIYRSIQGESTWAGLPCTFVRFTGCNLRCTWCDTAYAFHDGERTVVGDVLEKVAALGVPLVEITGGEPLLQKACPTLATCLLERGYRVLCETSGALPISILPADVVKIMDLKCPGSGEAERNHWPNIEALSKRDEVKFVLADRADYEWARDRVREHDLVRRCGAVLFSSAFGQASPRDIVEWILADGLEVRFQLQMHKYIWAPEKKGV
jgi:7-carboxy-7-deazaguanine synthase